ncbi:MAG: phophatidylserine decarboxylase associated domain-containing protein [Ignavibacteria bacterium]
MKNVSLKIAEMDPVQKGFWVPNRVWVTTEYFIPLRKELIKRRREGLLPALSPVMEEFKNWVDNNPVYKEKLTAMLIEVGLFIKTTNPEIIKEIAEDGDYTKVMTLNDLYDHLNIIITTSPSFNETVMVGTPMNGLLAIAMGTKTGGILFHDMIFNEQFKKVLDAWNTYLKSSDSLDKLDINDPEKEGSWISLEAHDAGVWTDMVYDPNKPAYGYDSWNSFFIRPFQDGARPFKGDPQTVINIGCETTPWEYQDNVALSAEFWAKEMPYSLVDILGGDKGWAEKFEGGQVYQGFLSATHYHRWSAPVDGKIVRSWVQPGTYFAQRPGQGEVPGTWEGTESQPYLSEVAARAIFIMEHEKFGYIAMVCIGMVEVSTCHINPEYVVGEGDEPVEIKRGNDIGHFEFGGSTHAMIFQKDKAKLAIWAENAVKFRNLAAPIQMGSVIATLP